MIKIDLNSNNYFSTTNAANTNNRIYAINSNLFKQNQKYKLRYAFLSKHFVTTAYPPALLSDTLNTTTLAGQLYGNGVYNVTRSSANDGSREARNLFDGGDVWRPVGTLIGAWVQLQLPSAIVLDSYQVTTNVGGGRGVPSQFKLEGSNDNFVTNVLLNTVTDWGINEGSRTIRINPPVNQAFSYFRLTNLGNPQSSSIIEYKYLLLFFADVYPLEPAIININLNQNQLNYKPNNNNSIQNDKKSGVLQVKNKNLYCKIDHCPPITFTSLDANFIGVDLYKLDGTTNYNMTEPYNLSLEFEEIY